MPELIEAMYCSQQIFVPPNLPVILKKYAKAAIRTQPTDLLLWSTAYFKALAQGVPPPAKERLEYPPMTAPSGLSPGFLKVLVNQIGRVDTVKKQLVEERWSGVCLDMDALTDLMDVGLFGDDVHWLHFVAVCAGTLEPNLTRTMVLLCELLTDEPDGGSASVPLDLFLDLYKFLAKIDCGPTNKREQLIFEAKQFEESQGDESKIFDENCEGITGMRKESKKLKYGSDVEPMTWDQALEELKVTSDMSAETIPEVTSEAGIGVWPVIRDESLQHEVEPREKQPSDELGVVTSEYGLEVFTNVEEATKVEIVEVTSEVRPTRMSKESKSSDKRDSKGDKRRSTSRKSSVKGTSSVNADGEETEVTDALEDEDETNIFAPRIDSFTDLLEGQEMPVEEEYFGEEEEEHMEEEQIGEAEEVEEAQLELEKPEEEGEPLVTLLSPDSSMDRLVTPTHSTINVETDAAIFPDACTYKEKISVTQKLKENISMADVRVAPPDVKIEEVEAVHEGKQPKWMDIPGIGPVVPDEIIVQVEKYFTEVAASQSGMVMPRNIRHYRCPTLDASDVEGAQ